jgi:polyphosphate kinase
VKVRVLDNEQQNAYKHTTGRKMRAQVEIFKYLHEKTYL